MYGFGAGIFFVGYALSRSRATSFTPDGARFLDRRILFDVGPGIWSDRLHPRRHRLLPVRVLLGVAEAGLFPGVFYI